MAMFEGFDRMQVATGGAMVNLVRGLKPAGGS